MARRKSRSKKDRDIEFLTEVNIANCEAKKEGPKKRYSIHDLKTIKPKNEAQRQFFEAYLTGNNVVGSGSAGTGKTFLSVYLALNDILDTETERDRIIIVRSAVQGRQIGFTPGDINEKMAPYETPYVDTFAELLRKKTAYQDMKDAGLVQFMPTSFLRGNSWDNAVIIFDEIQNCNLQEIITVVTRCGENSKIIAVGDMVQNDLVYHKNDQSGMETFLRIVAKMKEFDVVTFTKQDIVRSSLVKSFIYAYEDVVGKY